VTGITYYLFALFLVAALGWQLVTGRAMGIWRFSNVRREDSPLIYWLSLSGQFVILLLFLFTGRAWHIR
jgi:hypothetical protein